MERKDKIMYGTGMILFGILISVATTIHAIYYAPQMEVRPEVLAQTKTGLPLPSISTASQSDIPVRIVIPSIHVDTVIDPVGITFKGNMSVPNNFTDVGWYKYGTIPGALGSALMDGHVDNGIGMDAVFKHLKEVPIGGDIYVYTQHGTRLHFVVSDIENYYYTSVPMGDMLSTRDTARLDLITCDGTWISDAHTDDHRIVVYSTLVTN